MAFTGILSLAASVAAFQQYEIGMSLEYARSIHMPAGSHGPINFGCTGDIDAPRLLRLTEIEQSVGIVRCWPMQRIGSSLGRASVDIGGGISATVEFRFYNNSLYEIRTVYDESSQPTIERALQQRFGQPTGREDGLVQNLYGAEFDQKLVTWDTGEHQITLISPALNLSRMIVLYRDKVVADAVNEKIEAEEANQLSI